MNQPPHAAVLAVVTLTEKSILPAGSRNVLSCAVPGATPFLHDSPNGPSTLLCRPQGIPCTRWLRTRLMGLRGLGVIAAVEWSEATPLLFP